MRVRVDNKEKKYVNDIVINVRWQFKGGSTNDLRLRSQLILVFLMYVYLKHRK